MKEYIRNTLVFRYLIRMSNISTYKMTNKAKLTVVCFIIAGIFDIVYIQSYFCPVLLLPLYTSSHAVSVHLELAKTQLGLIN